MDEQYIQDLWNWTTSQDPTFTDRYTFASWRQKLSADEGYRQDFHSWVSSQDSTFSRRRPLNKWSVLVGGTPSVPKVSEQREAELLKKKEDTDLLLEDGSSESQETDQQFGFMQPPTQEELLDVGVKESDDVLALPTTTEVAQEVYAPSESGQVIPAEKIAIDFLAQDYPLTFQNIQGEGERLLASEIPKEDLQNYERLQEQIQAITIPAVEFPEATDEYKERQRLMSLANKIEQEHPTLSSQSSDTPLVLNKEQQQYVSDLSGYESEKSKDATKIDKEQSEAATRQAFLEGASLDEFGNPIDFNPDVYEENIEKFINFDLIDGKGISSFLPGFDTTEEDAVFTMRSVFGTLGFKFKEEGAGDYMRVIAPNKEEVLINLDQYGSDGDIEQMNILKDFMRKNKPKIKKDAKLKRYESQELINNDMDYLNFLAANYGKQKVGLEKSNNEYYKLLASYNNMTEAERSSTTGRALQSNLIERKKAIAKQSQALEYDEKALTKRGAEIDVAAGKYATLQKYLGTTFAGKLANIFTKATLKGSNIIASGTAGTGLDVMQGLQDVGILEKGPDFATALSKDSEKALANAVLNKYGRTYEELLNDDSIGEEKLQEIQDFYNSKKRNYARFEQKKQIQGDIRRGFDKVGFGTQEAYEDLKENSEFWKVAYSVGESLPSMVYSMSGPMGFFQSTQFAKDMFDEEIQNAENGREVDTREVAIYNSLLATPIAALDKLGFGWAVRGTGGKLLAQAIAKTAYKDAAKTGAKLTAKSWQKSVMKTIENKFAKFLMGSAGAGASEFVTGTLQGVVEYTGKPLINYFKDEKVYDTPELNSSKYWKGVWENGYYEMLGGLFMGVPIGISQSMSKQDFSKMDNDSWELFKQMRNDPKLLKLSDSKFLDEIALGKSTPMMALKIKNQFKEASNLLDQIPNAETYTVEQQKDIMGLLLRRQELQNRVKAKDKSLSSKDNKEITQIEQKLVEFSDSAGDVNYALNKTDDRFKDIKDDDEVEIVVESLDDVPKGKFGLPMEGTKKRKTGTFEEVEVGDNVNGLPIGKNKKKVSGTYYTYTLTGKQINNAIQKQSTNEVDANQSTEAIQEVEEGVSATGPEVTAQQEGQQVSEEQQKKLNTLGFTDEVIEMMTPEDIEVAQKFTEPSQATEMVERYQQDMEAAQSLAAEDTTAEDVETVGVAGEVTEQNKGKIKYNSTQAKIIRQAQKAVQSVKKIMPNLRIITYATDEEYAAAVPKSKIGERGEISKDGNTIRINLAAADITTVGHEIFHAIITSKFNINSKKIATAVNNDLIKKLLKILPKDEYRMNVVDKITKERKQISLHEYLEEYVKEYDDTETHSEEKLAQIFGFLGANYSTLTYQEQSVITKFFNKLRTLFGKEAKGIEFSKDEARVADLLNTLAYKVKVGEEIEEGDLELFDEVAEEVEGKPTETTTEEVVEETPAEEAPTEEAPAEEVVEEEVVEEASAEEIQAYNKEVQELESKIQALYTEIAELKNLSETNDTTAQEKEIKKLVKKVEKVKKQGPAKTKAAPAEEAVEEAPEAEAVEEGVEESPATEPLKLKKESAGQYVAEGIVKGHKVRYEVSSLEGRGFSYSIFIDGKLVDDDGFYGLRLKDIKEQMMNNIDYAFDEEFGKDYQGKEAPTSRKQVAAKESVAPMKVNEEFSKMTPEQKRKQLGGRYGILSLELKKGLFFAEEQYKKRDEYDRLSKSNKLKDMDLFAKKYQGNPPMTEAQIFLNSGGWYRGVDGEYRYEIPDGKLAKGSYKDFTRASKKADTREARLDEVYIAPEVYKTYPFLKDIMVQFTAMTIDKNKKTTPNTTTIGSWNPATKIIKFNTNYSEFAKATPEEQRNEIFYTIIHEVQHAIQDFEGFAMGGTDVETKDGLGKRVTEKFGKGREGLTKERIFASEAQKGLKKKYERFRINNEFIDYLSAALNKLEKLGEKDLYNKLLKSKNKGKDLVDIVLQYEATDATMNRIYREIKEDAKYYNRELGRTKVNMTQKNLKEFFDNTNHSRHILDEYGINNAQTGSQINAIQKSLLKRLRMYNAYKMYERTYGEIEARNVEERAKIKKELARYKSELDKLNRLGKKEVANEIFTKELYDYLSENVIDIEDVIGEGVTYEDFKIFLKNKSYSKEIYGYLTMKDSNYSRDVTLGEFQRNVEGLTTEEKIREIEEQLYKQLPTVTEDSKGLIEDIDKGEQGPYIMKSYPKAKRKQVASKQKVEMTTQEENAQAKEKIEGMNRKQLPSPNASMEDVIAWGRSRGESDAVLRMFLKSRGYGTIKEIREAMAQTVQMAAMPADLANIEGGLEVAEKMYEDIMTEFYDATMETKEVVEESKKRIAKAKQVMRNNPEEYGVEKDGVFTKPNGEKVTLDITKAKGGVKIKTATQVLGSSATSMQNVFTKSKAQRRAILQEIIEKNEDYQNQDEANKALIQTLLDRALNTRANPSIEARMKDVKRIAKAAEQNEKKLQEVRNRLRALIRESIPKVLQDKSTTKNLNAMIKSLAKVNSTNVLVETTNILKQIEAINKKETESLRERTLKIIKSKARKAPEGKTTSVDADTNMFMQEILDIWETMDKLLKQENSEEAIAEYLGKIQMELEMIYVENGKVKLADIDTIVEKTIEGIGLKPLEQRKLFKSFAYDMMYNYPSLDYDGMQNLYEEIALLKKEGLDKFKSNREARIKEVTKLRREAENQIKEDYPYLVDENGNIMDSEQIKGKQQEILEEFKQTLSYKKLLQWAKLYLGQSIIGKGIDGSKNAMRTFLASNQTISNALDRQGVGNDFFTRNIYQRLRDMRDAYLKGVQSQQRKTNEILNTIPGIADKTSRFKTAYGVLVDMLSQKQIEVTMPYNIYGDENIGKPRRKKLTRDEALRIYALWQNRGQRTKLQSGTDSKGRGTFITQDVVDEIKQKLQPELIQFADKMISYLSNEYYNSINEVYMQVNDASLSYVENYFPTQTFNAEADRKKTSMLTKEESMGDFNQVFNVETAPALHSRTNTAGRIKIDGISFTGELSNHFEQMERFMSYAEGVKTIRDITRMDAVVGLLNATGLTKIFKRNLMTTINPNAFNSKAEASLIGKALNNFSAWALGFKLWQIPKQATSFVNAFEDYDSGLIKKDIDGLGITKSAADILMFMVDMAATIGSLTFELMPESQRKKLGIPDGPLTTAYKESATFRDRIQQGIQGDLWGLESGQKINYENTTRGVINPQFKRLRSIPKKIRQVGTFPTMIGDILGVMGYMINYRRDLKNGMSKTEALRKFNRYEATQQTRGETEKNRLQLESNDYTRAFTMFGSTIFLQQNKIAQSYSNITNAIGRGKMPRKQDIRAFYLNLGIANVAFVYMSNIFKYAFGDDEDKEDVMEEMWDVMRGLNSLKYLPFLGDPVAEWETWVEGKGKYPKDQIVNPFLILWRKTRDAYEKEGYEGIPTWLTQAIIGVNADPFVGLYNKLKEPSNFFIMDGDFYKMLGVSKSYRPSQINEDSSDIEEAKEAEESAKLVEELMKD